MVIQIRLKGVNRVNRLYADLPKRLVKEIMKRSVQWNKAVQKSAKLRAPRGTGELARSIVVNVRGKTIRLIADSPYAIFQEEGFRPHWVHALMPTRNSQGTIGDAFNIAGFAFVSKHTPFMGPALEANIARLPTMLRNGARDAINKSRR